jgi:hypothetical protein
MLQRPVGCWRCGWRLGRRVPAWAGDGARSCHELQAQIGARKEEMEKKEEMEEKQEMGCKRSLLGRVRVVLVSPQQAGNIGSVCRVTTNFECNDLWLVNPQCNYKGEEAQVMAANAASRSKLEQVHVSESLSAALKGCSMVSKGVIDCRFSFISPPAHLHSNRVFFFFLVSSSSSCLFSGALLNV